MFFRRSANKGHQLERNWIHKKNTNNNNSRVYYDSAQNQSQVLTSCNLNCLWRQIFLTSLVSFALIVHARGRTTLSWSELLDLSRGSAFSGPPRISLICAVYLSVYIFNRAEKLLFTMLVTRRKSYYSRIQVTKNSKHLMTGPEGNSEFCFPRRSWGKHWDSFRRFVI